MCFPVTITLVNRRLIGGLYMPLIKSFNLDNNWPYGKDGNLVVNNGETHNLTSGSIYDFANVTINTGGILQIVGDDLNFTMLGIRGNLILNGGIRLDPTSSTGSVSNTTPDKVSVSATISQAAGGAGGAGSAKAGGAGGAGGEVHAGRCGGRGAGVEVGEHVT